MMYVKRLGALKQAKMPRCKFCRKKSPLEFECLCKGVFCVTCRLPEVHKCTFDRETYEKNALREQLVKVEGEKLKERL